MSTPATYDDVNLILRLYEERREPRLREARGWFSRNFKANSWEEFRQLCPIGSDNDASFRMVVTYWEMVASFITSGVLNEDLFLQSGRELLFVWERIKNLLPIARQEMKDPALYRNFEQAANRLIEGFKRTSGNEAYEAFCGRVMGIVAAASGSAKA